MTTTALTPSERATIEGARRAGATKAPSSTTQQPSDTTKGDGLRLNHPGRVSQLDHLNLTVKNLQSSLAFYEEMFGFVPVEVHDGNDPYPWTIVRSGSAMLCLYEHTSLPTSERFPHPPSVQEVRHFAFRVEDGPAFARLCDERGLPLLFGGPVRWPHSTSYYIEDPTGHHIEVVAWDNNEIRFD